MKKKRATVWEVMTDLLDNKGHDGKVQLNTIKHHRKHHCRCSRNQTNRLKKRKTPDMDEWHHAYCMKAAISSSGITVRDGANMPQTKGYLESLKEMHNNLDHQRSS